MRALAAALALLAAASAPRPGTPRAAAQGAPTQGVPRVQMGVSVRPETVTVGEHFVLTLRVRAPRGADIGFPVGPDSGMSVEAVDPRDVVSSSDTTAVDRTAVYRLVAWDTGATTAHLGDVVVSIDGADRRIPVTGDSLHVRSVLPRDTALQVPKPARGIIPAPRPWWQWLLLALVVAALLALLIWWWRRRRARAHASEADPYGDAEREFARIESLALLEAGERGRYLALHIEVLRDYLAARVAPAVRSLTSTELLAAVRDRREVPAERLAPLLAEADLVKFARRPITAERARDLGREAHGIVDAVELDLEAQRARAAAQAAGKAA